MPRTTVQPLGSWLLMLLGKMREIRIKWSSQLQNPNFGQRLGVGGSAPDRLMRLFTPKSKPRNHQLSTVCTSN
eukprot:1760138-Rhodomonas_salina.5